MAFAFLTQTFAFQATCLFKLLTVNVETSILLAKVLEILRMFMKMTITFNDFITCSFETLYLRETKKQQKLLGNSRTAFVIIFNIIILQTLFEFVRPLLQYINQHLRHLCGMCHS